MSQASCWSRAALVVLALASLLAVGAEPPLAARAEPACPPSAGASGARYVVWVPGLLSSSLTGVQPGTLDPANHQVRDEFAVIRDTLAAGLTPPPRFVYFSYGMARLARAGQPPERAWVGDSEFDEHEPRYWASDTSSYPLQAHADALDWLLRDLLRCDSEATVDVIGFSLGGVVALRWAATADPGPDGPLAAVHRVIVVDSPVGGVNPTTLRSAITAAPPATVSAAGTGAVLGDLLPGGEVIRSLPGAIGRVDVASVENSRDYLVNGAPLPAQTGLGPDGWLARGAALTFLAPERHPDVYTADMGAGVALGPTLWDYLVGIHGAVLTDPGALQRLLDLLRTDGPVWQSRYPEDVRLVP
jgi:pimeloyl-ACP methyl ester carboxylesterase